MKNQLIMTLALAIGLFSMACSGAKKGKSAVGKEATVWVKSDYIQDVTIHDEVGVLAFEKCYGISYDEKLEKGQFGHVEKKWQPACGGIAGFEYEQGFYYQLILQQTMASDLGKSSGHDLNDWKLVKVLSKEKDVHYERRETRTAWVGPKKIEVRCSSPMAPPSCREMRHQAQFGELNKTGEWKPLYDIYGIPDYEEGYIYQIKYTKVYMSEFENNMTADHQGFNVEGLEVLSKTKA